MLTPKSTTTITVSNTAGRGRKNGNFSPNDTSGSTFSGFGANTVSSNEIDKLKLINEYRE